MQTKHLNIAADETLRMVKTVVRNDNNKVVRLYGRENLGKVNILLSPFHAPSNTQNYVQLAMSLWYPAIFSFSNNSYTILYAKRESYYSLQFT